jgi:DegV family protein with EDD domain
MTVRIVTDSVTDLPQSFIDNLGVSVVPLTVRFGHEELRDGIDLTRDEFYERLVAAKELPTTSAPSIGQFVEAFEKAGDGADGIVCIVVSSKVSATHNSAVQAAAQVQVDCPIEVVDTLQASMGIGMVVLAAGRAAAQGASVEEVVKVARSAVERCQCFATLDTLEYLHRGGRIGMAQAFLGSVLKVKPMIILTGGEVHPLDRPRTRARAVARLMQVARDFSPVDELAVIHSTTPDEAATIARELGSLLPDGREPIMARFGPVLGVYVGPAALGVGLLQSEDR